MLLFKLAAVAFVAAVLHLTLQNSFHRFYNGWNL